MLSRFHPLYINTHFNHPLELTPAAREATALLADAGIPLGNQTVLLRGVNDSADTIEELCRGLLAMRVRPYYMFMCDLWHTVQHFRVPLAVGQEIVRHLRQNLSGLAIPRLVIDLPGGHGKVPVTPEYIVETRRKIHLFSRAERGKSCIYRCGLKSVVFRVNSLKSSLTIEVAVWSGSPFLKRG